ncbi:hypothetical protein T261_6002 [Streptomyces lydicus]|nr:hypothetical protein T261_6002 [Streptomyces lydicus]
MAARASSPTAAAQAAQGQSGRGSPWGAPVPRRVSSTRRFSPVRAREARGGLPDTRPGPVRRIMAGPAPGARCF